MAWYPVDEAPSLASDHDEMLARALACLRERIETTEIALGMMPEHFTLAELQKVYEAVMAESLDPAAFRDWVLSRGWIEQTDSQNDS